MARSWNFFLKASLAGAILWGLALLWTGHATAQDEMNQSPESTTDPVQAVEYEGDENVLPFSEEGTTAASVGQPDSSIDEAMDEVRKAYLNQQYAQVIDLCEEIRRDYPAEVGRVDFYKNVSQRRLEALSRKESENRPYPRISELMPSLPTEEPQPTTASAPQQASSTTTATTAVTAPAVGPSNAMPLPSSMAPAPPRPASRSGLMTTLTSLPIWMYALIGVVAIALIGLILKLVTGRKDKGATEAVASSKSAADQNEQEMAVAETGDDSMFDPLGGISAADDPFATISSDNGDDPFSMMFGETSPKTEKPAPQPQEAQEPLEAPANDLSAFESLLEAKVDKPSPQTGHHVTGPINFSFEDEEVEETIQAPASSVETGVESIMDLFDDDDGQSDIPAQVDETPAEMNDDEDILTFDGMDDSAPSPQQEADTKLEDSVSDVFDEDFSISLDQSISENTAMQETRSTGNIDSSAPDKAGETEGEDLLLFDEAYENTNIANLHIDETINLDQNDARQATDSQETLTDQTQISPPLPEDADAFSMEDTQDSSASDLFDKERMAGQKAFDDSNWKSAVHHLTIAAALQPESTEVKALLREASRQSKTEAEVSER